jgi:hypothetical protein
VRRWGGATARSSKLYGRYAGVVMVFESFLTLAWYLSLFVDLLWYLSLLPNILTITVLGVLDIVMCSRALARVLA